jgi:chitinase
MHSTTILHTLLFIIGHAFAAYDNSSKTNLAVYWGQNSLGLKSPDPKAQGPLSQYCADEDVDIIIIGFISALVGSKGEIELNLANQLNWSEGAQPYPAPQTGADIKTCQKTNNKTILLSFGGQEKNLDKGYTSDSEAQAGAKKIWDMFGPKTTTSSVRPFDDAVVDGFDFDFEDTAENFASRHRDAFIKELSSLVKAEETTAGKKFYFSAAPECMQKNSLISSIKYDMVFVQFYNNPTCDVDKYQPGEATNTYFNQWDEIAKANGTKFFVGLPGFSSAALAGGYVSPTNLTGYLKQAHSLPNMAGAMVWDASQAWANELYHKKVNTALLSN